MNHLTSQQRHDKTSTKQAQGDADISSAEREQARRSANMALHNGMGVRTEATKA